MKEDLTFEALVKEARSNYDLARDFILNTGDLFYTEGKIAIPEMGIFTLGYTAEKQIATWYNIPIKYLYRLKNDGRQGALDGLIQWHFSNVRKNAMIRTLGDRARALLSTSYERRDNWQVLGAILPTLQGIENLTFRSVSINEDNMYLKLLIPDLEREVTPGDVVRFGVLIQNSEVGKGSVYLAPFVERLVCTNGLVVTSLANRSYHVGRRKDLDVMLTDKTKRLDDEAFTAKVGDIIKYFLSPSVVERITRSFREASEKQIEENPIKVITELQRDYSVTESEGEKILAHLIKGGNLTTWGYVNAITRAAEDAEAYSRATELEMIGGVFLNNTLAGKRKLRQTLDLEKLTEGMNI